MGFTGIKMRIKQHATIASFPWLAYIELVFMLITFASKIIICACVLDPQIQNYGSATASKRWQLHFGMHLKLPFIDLEK